MKKKKKTVKKKSAGAKKKATKKTASKRVTKKVSKKVVKKTAKKKTKKKTKKATGSLKIRNKVTGGGSDWAFIELNHGFKAKVDRSELKRLSNHTWRIIQRAEGKSLAVTTLYSPDGAKQVSLGKFIMKPSKGKMVYPRRSNRGLDYRKSNLIVCTMAQRQIMLPKQRTESSSKFKGVCWDTRRQRWRASLEYKRTSVNLGFYKSEVDAALAYNEGARKYFGVLAYQNQVKESRERRNR